MNQQHYKMKRMGLLKCLAMAIGLSSLGIPAAEPRAARSVHLGYPGPDASMFYNEVVVEQSVKGSYFMACGWNGGYFGIQQGASGGGAGSESKVVIFSVWDPTKGDKADSVPLEKRVEVLYEGKGVNVSRFGGEGTGGKSIFPHQWKLGETNRFLVEATVEGEKTTYTGWFWMNDKSVWKRLVTFRTASSAPGRALSGYYSFVEDFRRDGKSVGEVRKARFGNGWLKPMSGAWLELNRARFTASSADWESKDNINAGVADGGWFCLATGGDTKKSHELKAMIERAKKGDSPRDLPGDAH